MARYPALNIVPTWTHEEYWEVRLDALKTRRGFTFWAIIVLSATLAALMILVVVAA